MVEEKDVLKTGTTTVGIVCKDGVVLASDKRVTAGYLVANKKFDKTMVIADNVAVTVAGTVSDVQLMAKYIKAELRLKQYRTNRTNTVREAANMLAMLVYGNIRKYSVIPGISHFIVGGFDDEGYHLFDLGPDGSLAEIDDYVTSGSGSVYTLGVFETLYDKNASVADGVKLAVKAINAAVQRDVASGNGVDVTTITKDGIKKVITKEIDMKLEA